MMDNEARARYGADAVQIGTPDYGANGADADGRLTDAGDAIANILHWLALEAGYALPLIPDNVGAALALANDAVDRARLHFDAEIHGEA